MVPRSHCRIPEMTVKPARNGRSRRLDFPGVVSCSFSHSTCASLPFSVDQHPLGPCRPCMYHPSYESPQTRPGCWQYTKHRVPYSLSANTAASPFPQSRDTARMATKPATRGDDSLRRRSPPLSHQGPSAHLPLFKIPQPSISEPRHPAART